jgi:hypothetical membrane protein
LRRERLLALGGLVGPLAFVSAWVVAGAAAEAYSPVDDAISDLAAVGASTRLVMTIGFVVFGLGLIAFGIALRGALDGHAWIAATATGACTIGVAATPLDGWPGDTMHAIFAGLGYATIVALPLLASMSFARRGQRAWALASRVTAIATALCLVASTFGPAHGLWQRLGLTIADVWIAVVALRIAMNWGAASRLTEHQPAEGSRAWPRSC